MSGRRAVLRAVLLTVALLVVPGCVDGPAAPRLVAQPVVVAAAWNDADSAVERSRFMAVLDRFTDQTGVPVQYRTAGRRTDFATWLTDRIGGDDPPDVALLPQPGLLRTLASCGVLTALPPEVEQAVSANYPNVWKQLATVDGRLYGVVFKVANKSTVWYDPHLFEQAHIRPPATWDDLLTTAQRITAFGLPAFSISAADPDGWVLTDWFENVYLRTAGPDRYDKLAQHQLGWTDPSVTQALTVLGQLWGHRELLTPAPLTTTLQQSIDQVYRFNQAAMVYEGDFLVSQISTIVGKAQFDQNASFFDFPSINRSPPSVVAGGDIAVMTKDRPDGRQLMRYLASPEAAKTWARAGGFISPNKNVDLDAYADPVSRQSAVALRHAADAGAVRFDLSDQLPPEFGSTPGAGLQAFLRDFLRNPTAVSGNANVLELKARGVAGRPPVCPSRKRDGPG